MTIKSLTCIIALVACALIASPLLAAQFSDDFTNPAELEGLAATWQADDSGVSIESGALLTSTGPDRSFAIWRKAPMGRSVTFSAMLTPGGATMDGWDVTGIGVYASDSDYWHLALVISPSAQKSTHFAELTEMRNGHWLAQYDPSSKLSTVVNTGSFEWKQGTKYELRLTLGQGQIDGVILDGATVKFHCAYKLDAPAVSYGRPMIDCAGMMGRYEQARATVDDVVPDPAAEVIPKFVSFPQSLPGGSKTGYFHVETIGERSWLVDPNGRLTFSIGTDHVNYGGASCESLGFAPYGRNVAAKYASQEVWAQTEVDRLKSWNFNVLGAGCGTARQHAGLAHTIFLSLGTKFVGTANIVPRTTWTGFPDVFDPRYAHMCDLVARKMCGPNRADPWLLGYFIDNELEWFGAKPTSKYGLPLTAWTHTGDSACKRALVDEARNIYGVDIVSFNTDFGKKYTSFDEMLADTVPGKPVGAGATRLLETFIQATADRFFDTTTTAIQRYDPNHLVLGVRFAGDAPDACWHAAGRTCKLVTVNIYPRVDLISKSSPQLVDRLTTAYALCKKPLVVTEWSFPALDAVDWRGTPLPCKGGAGMRVDTQEQKAACYSVMLKTLASTPYVIGSHYFMWADEPAAGISSTFPEDSNYGLVDDMDRPYAVLTSTATHVNNNVIAIHAGLCARLSAVVKNHTIMVANTGKVAATVPIAIWANGERKDVSIPLGPGQTYVVDSSRFERQAGGGLYLHVACDPEQTIPQSANSDQTADLILPPATVRPGQHAVVVWNPSSVSVSNAVATLNSPHRQSVDAGPLRPYGAQTVWISEGEKPAPANHAAISFTLNTGGFAIDNGALKLVKDQQSGAIFDRVLLHEAESDLTLGSLWPLIQFQTPTANVWVRPSRVVDVQVASRDNHSLALDITAQCDAADTGYKCAYRIETLAGQPCFLSRLLWIENTSSTPLDCKSYFHYPISSIGGDLSGDAASPNVPNYVMNIGVWRNAKLAADYGAAALGNDSRIAFGFYKDEDGNEHPDCRRAIDLQLKPGQRWQPAEAEPAILITGLRETGTSGRQAFHQFLQELQAQFSVQAREF